MHEDVLDALQRMPSAQLQAIVRIQLATACVELGDRARAVAVLDEFRARIDVASSRLWVGRVLKLDAQLAEQAGDYVEAERLVDESIASERRIGDQPGLIESLTLRGIVALERGVRQVASDAFAEALEIAAPYGSKLRLAQLFEAVASLVVGTHPAMCVRLAAGAEQLRLSLGAAPTPIAQARVGHALDAAKRRLGARAYADVWMDAHTQPLESIIDEARQLLHSIAPLTARSVGPVGSEALSEREREVAILVARGLTNRQIAEELVITRKTAETHCRSSAYLLSQTSS
jgi:ATP/maltotriose-dependent transcriptional regulator MalT